MNGLTDDQIVSVKKDAIYTIGQCKRLRFGLVQFVAKNTYSSYLRFPNIQNLEIYYSSEATDVKGMGDTATNRHRLYMLNFLRTMISLIEHKDRGCKRRIMKFIEEYKAHELDEGYYLEFNNLSRAINPSFNYLNVIVPLVQIINREIQ